MELDRIIKGDNVVTPAGTFTGDIGIAPEKLYIETAYVALRSELIKTFARWHLLSLSPQAAVLKR
jgi:hypothetical protein